MSLHDLIDHSPMSRFQIRVIVICVFLSIMDGFDLLVMSFAASGVAKEWHLNATQVGLLLSAGLVGAALGAATLAPIADRIGRRPLILASICIALFGMALAVVTTGFVQLGICRLVTGIGIGGLISTLPVIIAEYTPARRRGTAIALYSVGVPLGGFLGGAVSALVIATYGWRATFAFGAALTVVMLVVTFVALPESIAYLAARRPQNAKDRIDQLLARMSKETLAELPDVVSEHQRGALAAIMRGKSAAMTLLVWLAFLIFNVGFYFLASWTPRLLEHSGIPLKTAITGGTLFSVGGVVASLLFSALALVLTRRLLTVVCFFCSALAFIGMSAALGNTTAALISAGTLGVIAAAASGLYALTPDLYPPAARATAVGWASAIGRAGGIGSPILAGILVDANWTPSALYALFAAPMVIGALAIAAATRKRRSPFPAAVDAQTPAVSP